MPSLDERREVAAKLRKLEAENHWERGRFIAGFIDALGLESRANVGECLLHLAGLIEPEQTHICLGCIKWSAIEGNPVKGTCAEFSDPEDGIERATPYYGYCHEWEGA